MVSWKMSARKSSLVGMKRKRHATSIAAGARRGIAPLDEDAVEAIERECPRDGGLERGSGVVIGCGGVVGCGGEASGGVSPMILERTRVECRQLENTNARNAGAKWTNAR